MNQRILCVDDNARNLRILEELLSEDYDIDCAECGEDALHLTQSQQFDLVLLDVMMPGISGYEVCRNLKTDPFTADTPIVLVTARAGDAEQQEGKAAGADAYLLKPFDPDQLLDLVEEFVPCQQNS